MIKLMQMSSSRDTKGVDGRARCLLLLMIAAKDRWKKEMKISDDC
jgi:hypothetical protein